MIIQKIEKFSEISIAQDNEEEKKAALQSCYYNLQNLKKIVDSSFDSIHHETQVLNKFHSSPRYKVSETNLTLPQIPLNNNRAQQLSCISHNFQPRKNKQLAKYSYNSLLDISNKQMPTNRRGQTILSDLSAKYNLKAANIETSSFVAVKQPENSKKKQKKPVKFRTRKQKPHFVLPKNQKYFQETEINVPKEIVEKLGLYEASNLYKKNTIQKFLNEGYASKFNPVINLKFATFSLCNRNQFFLTYGECMPELNEADSSGSSARKIEEGESKKKSEKKVIELEAKQNYLGDRGDSILEKENEETQNESMSQGYYKNINWVMTIQNYEVVKNEQYFGFKKDNISEWNELKFILHTICLYLKKVKISLLSFKFEKNLFLKELWSCQKIKEGVLENLLKIKLTVKDQEQKQQKKTIRLFNNRAEVIKYLVQMWKDRQSLENMKKIKQKQRQRLIWSAIRITAKHKVRLAKRKRAARAATLNEKLKQGEWDHEIEIHIPSFSENEFVRNTTQYMEHYENMFYHLWKSSNKQFVLIIPAINQTILQLFQNKIKLSKNITLICPQSHHLYPKSLPLAATLLYSKEALHKIRRILEGKKGIIIPGRQLSNQFLYEQHLSDLLNCPIFSALKLSALLGDNKNIWLKHEIPTAPFTVIQPRSTIEVVIQKFSQLLFNYPKTKIWVFKINKQFNGRGIALFDAYSSKKLKQILSFQESREGSEKEVSYEQKLNERRKMESKNLVMSYLQMHFRLKLKINFQNCIFRVEQYIQTFLQKGGIIEEFIQDCQTFQFCYKLEPGYVNYSHLYILDEIEQQKYICCTQNYEVNFVTKSSLFVNQNVPKMVKEFSRKVEKLLKAERYLGYVSVTVLYSSKRQQYYAVEIKPYMTINSSMSYLIKVFTNKKTNNTTNRRNGNIMSNSNLQSGEISLTENQNKLLFLFIPCIIFTDVDQEVRSQVIENLVMGSWEKISNKLFTQPIVTENPDTFHGTLYMSLGLTLGILIYGKPHDLRKMKNQAIECARELSDKIQSIKLYRGKQETRDVFQFGDLIRAITKIKS